MRRKTKDTLRSERLSLRLRKFKSASAELPSLITFTEVTEKLLGFCFTSNDENSKYNSLIFHLFRLHVHIRLPKFISPMRYPIYTATSPDKPRRWKYGYSIRSYGLGYHFDEGSFYMLHGVQPDKDKCSDLARLKIWVLFNR